MHIHTYNMYHLRTYQKQEWWEREGGRARDRQAGRIRFL